MTRFIPDASLSLCWFLPEQATPASTALLTRAKEAGVIVPTLWHLEVVNKLGQQVRLRKLTPERQRGNLLILAALDVETRQFSIDASEILAGMARYSLTAYDAAYLQLAMTTGLPLATYDQALIAAARLAGVTLLP